MSNIDSPIQAKKSKSARKAKAKSPALSRFLCWPLALLFLYSGSIKLYRIPQFAKAVGEFGIVSDGLVQPTAIAVCVVELLLAYALWQQKSWSFVAAATLLISFLGVLSYGVSIGLDIECGCFGSGYKIKLRQQLGIDLVLLLWCAVSHFLMNTKERMDE